MNHSHQSALTVGQTPSRVTCPACGAVIKLAGDERGWSRATAWLPRLCVLQMLVICGGVAVAVEEIESIVGSGPAASVLGLAIAIIAWKANGSRWLLGFALSAPAVGLGVFLLIFFNSWGPGDAKGPVPPILVCYEYAIIPLGLGALSQFWSAKSQQNAGQIFQFGLSHLLRLTAYVAIVFAGLRLALNGQAMLAALAPGLATPILAFGLWRWHSKSRTASAGAAAD